MSIQPLLRKKRLLLSVILIFVLLLAATVIIIHYIDITSPLSQSNMQTDDGLMNADLARLSDESYESVLLSMHSSAGFSEEDFVSFRGLDTLVTSHALLGTEELSAYLDCILSSGNPVSHIYLCLDPELLWLDARKNSSQWNLRLQENLYNYIEAHSEITFEILLPYPYIEYWLKLKEKDFNTLITIYSALVNGLCAYPNTKTFFPGVEYWLMVNPDNYENTVFEANDVITQKLFLFTFCDGCYQITSANADSYWNTLQEIVARETASPTVYPNLSNWHLVFLGDSVFANFPGSYSIPGYVEGLSGAVTCNYAIGGSCASSFPEAADRVSEEEAVLSDSGEKICFIIQYGLNDYFSGAPVDNPKDSYDTASYKGGLRTGISRLQTAFPQAEFLIITSTHTGVFERGTAVMSREGDVLSAYARAAVEVAEELGIYYLDNYNDLIITDDNLELYLSDDIHPNELGRLVIAEKIMNFINERMEHTN